MGKRHLWFFDGYKTRHARNCPCRNPYFVIRERRPSTKTVEARGMQVFVDAIQSVISGKNKAANAVVREKMRELKRRARRMG